jgi:hypothetical protein
MTHRASPPSGKSPFTRGWGEPVCAGMWLVGGRAHHVFGPPTSRALPANAHAV